MKITPEAEPDDGLFDVLLIGDVTKRRPRAHPAEDLPRHAPAAPEGRAPARLDGLDRGADPASGRARRRAAGHDAGDLRGRSPGSASARALGRRGPGRAHRLVACGRRRALGFVVVDAVWSSASSPARFAVGPLPSSLSSRFSTAVTRFSSGSMLRRRFCTSSSRFPERRRRVHDRLRAREGR